MSNSARPVPTTDLPVPGTYNPGAVQYYEQYGQMCDWVSRCEECRTLVTLETIRTQGGCHKCGSRKFREPRTLSLWEWLQIKMGLIRFPHSDQFLAAFSAKRGQ